MNHIGSMTSEILQQEQSANWINVIKILSILVKKIDILELGIVKLGV